MKIDYLDYRPAIADPAQFAPTAVVAGRTVAGSGLAMQDYAVLRGDGEWVRVGRNDWFGARATVHIADAMLGAQIGDDVTLGRFGLIHACTVADGCVVGDGAMVLDGANVGPYSVVAAHSVVTPRKQFEGGWLYAGNPAQPVRRIEREEVAAAAAALRNGHASELVVAGDLPPLDMAPFVAGAGGTGTSRSFDDRSPRLGRAYVAPTAVLVGDVRLADGAGVYFACALVAGGAEIVVGPRTNIQDNTLLVTDAQRGALVIGADVTIGHNVRMGSGRVGDRALVGIGSIVGDGVEVAEDACIAAGSHVLPGTVVEAGWIWAGRPARAFRAIKDAEREWFARGTAVYVRYSAAYRGDPLPPEP